MLNNCSWPPILPARSGSISNVSLSAFVSTSLYFLASSLNMTAVGTMSRWFPFLAWSRVRLLATRLPRSPAPLYLSMLLSMAALISASVAIRTFLILTISACTACSFCSAFDASSNSFIAASGVSSPKSSRTFLICWDGFSELDNSLSLWE